MAEDPSDENEKALSGQCGLYGEMDTETFTAVKSTHTTLRVTTAQSWYKKT